MMSIPIRSIIVGAGLVAGLSAMASAQTTTTSSETKKFEVIAVDGNQLVVTLPEGTREIAAPGLHVHGERQATVGAAAETRDGRNRDDHQVHYGDAGDRHRSEERQGCTTSGASIIVRTDDGFKMFTQGDVDKRGVNIMRGGKPAAVSDFRPGDELSAIIITSLPPRVVTEQEVNATLTASGAPPLSATPNRGGAGAPGAAGSAPGEAGSCPGWRGICPWRGGNGAERRGDSTSGPRNGSERCGPCGGAIGWSGCRTRGCCSGSTSSSSAIYWLVGGLLILAALALMMRRRSRG